jgi:phospholipid/cholesterol/gamma-HCH transport system ATP-binding protein
MMSEATAIRVEDFEARYGDAVILENISFEVNQGEIFVILGGSGCGKSTLLKHLIGLYRPYRGHIWIDDTDLAAADEETLSKIQKRFGVLYQSGALLGSMTLAENVGLPLTAFTALPRQVIETIIRIKLDLVGLSGYEGHLPAELSGGMQKRAGLARAMALDPHILFFDEPSAGLDPITAAQLDHLLLEINSSLGTTMVIVTHELESIFAIAHRVIMLDKARRTAVAVGDPRWLKDNAEDPFVRDFFNRRAESSHGPADAG